MVLHHLESVIADSNPATAWMDVLCFSVLYMVLVIGQPPSK
jgi:hypothetical protein